MTRLVSTFCTSQKTFTLSTSKLQSFCRRRNGNKNSESTLATGNPGEYRHYRWCWVAYT